MIVVPPAGFCALPVGRFEDPLFRFYVPFAGSMPAARLIEREMIVIVAGIEGVAVVVVDLKIEVAKLILILNSLTHVLCHARCLLSIRFYVRRFVLEVFVVVHPRNALQ